MLHYVSHGLGKAALFLTAGTIIHQSGIRDVRSLGGLADRMPISAIAFIIGWMNIAGIPPTVGFISKLLVFTGVLKQGLHASLGLIVALAALIATVLTIAYALWTVRRIFYGPLSEHLKNVKEAPPIMTIPLIILNALSIVVGIYPGVILNPLLHAIHQLIHV
jgi:NADH-quinone oxidoreductase subunit M